jgi:hypothetical protein
MYQNQKHTAQSENDVRRAVHSKKATAYETNLNSVQHDLGKPRS